jgi:hypothetical protein
VEPVKIYKGTTRRIGVSFHVVSTSQDDFDVMWTKINKLTTLVYPQFSEGRSLVSTDPSTNKQSIIYAPFSQSIIAAPMIRLRIGDLIRSNYSKFNLARLFGYTYKGTKFDDINSPIAGSFPDAAQIESSFYRVGSKFLLKEGAKFSPAIRTSVPDSNPRVRATLPRGFVLEITKELAENYFECTVGFAQGDDVPQNYPDLNETIKYWSSGDEYNVVGNVYVVSRDDLKPAPSTKKKIDAEIQAQSSASTAWGSYSDIVSSFMDDSGPGKGNAVSRSFRSSGGKGLAGFIDSISFDWYDKVTWSPGIGEEGDTYGRVAPKMCKVTIAFTPVHDITPGLDHDGANRAPIYPVGPLAPQKSSK